MSQENVDALKQGYEAFASGDIDAAFATFADDIVWKGTGDSVPAGGTYNGIDEVKNRWLPEFAANYQDFRQNIEELIDAGDCVIGLGTSRSTVGGQEIKTDICHVWKYNAEGKVTEAQFFGDTGQVALALQAQEAKA
jgi:ketosteroid isomerase-like protein